MGHGGLVHVSSAIQFVHRADIGPSLLGLLFWDGVKGVQVSIVPLGGGDYLDQVVEVLAYLRVGIDLEGVRMPSIILYTSESSK